MPSDREIDLEVKTRKIFDRWFGPGWEGQVSIGPRNQYMMHFALQFEIKFRGKYYDIPVEEWGWQIWRGK